MCRVCQTDSRAEEAHGRCIPGLLWLYPLPPDSTLTPYKQQARLTSRELCVVSDLSIYSPVF